MLQQNSTDFNGNAAPSSGILAHVTQLMRMNLNESLISILYSNATAQWQTPQQTILVSLE